MSAAVEVEFTDVRASGAEAARRESGRQFR